MPLSSPPEASAIGLPVAFVLMRAQASLLVGVIRLDLSTLVTLTAVLALAAALAGYLPARRATQVDPISALRDSDRGAAPIEP